MVKGGGGLERKSKASQEIPSSSMADIAFLLLIFFMVSTVFQKDRNRPIEWTQAAATEKMDQKQKNIQNIWVESNGDVYINDLPIPMEEVSDLIRPMYASNRELLVSIRSDRAAPYLYIDAVQQELVAAGLLRVVFATELEQDMTRERR
ncbi:MAG: biopolymer transporter ExbD [Gemmatimonadota bacterium]|nr:biopolymer transporter ExbD [Gemmatimonadota bacterium]MDE2866412.1 biopolymer transporter ExbD [Gemmatimonadota bacterium]MXV97008.1 biopolymer transporter ExbD [Gemmatimonadota bacterium]MXX73289.1 biopolymer transporter ExbD [Gemmatimonadota bacterium]MYB07354.1 biopolymer transporter ExbD [Gemmatimonadota bacterium]